MNKIKVCFALASVAGLVALSGCVSVGNPSTHVWAGVSTNGIGYAERTVSTNGVTNAFSVKLTVPVNIQGILSGLIQSEF